MNILMTTLLDMEHDRNGVISVAGDLNRLLEAAGHPVRTITPKNSHHPDRSLVTRIISRLWRTTRQPLFLLLELSATLRKLTTRIAAHADETDAVIAHDLLTASAALSALGGRCPLLLVCHFRTDPWDEFSDAGLFPHHGFTTRWLRRTMERVLHDPRVTLVPVSRRNEELLRRLVPEAPPQRIQLAYPGVSAPEVTPLSGRKHNAVPVIINVGLLHWRKNQRLLPHVAVALKQMGVTCRFVLAGAEEPDEKAYLEELTTRCGVADLFTFWGQQERETVFRLMAEADLYLHTSLEESFGMTLVEAMSCNIPVMALEYEALQEILPDTPEAVIPQGLPPEQIAALLAPLLSDATRRGTLQSRQRAVYERCFSSKTFVARYREIIASAAVAPA